MLEIAISGAVVGGTTVIILMIVRGIFDFFRKLLTKKTVNEKPAANVPQYDQQNTDIPSKPVSLENEQIDVTRANEFGDGSFRQINFDKRPEIKLTSSIDDFPVAKTVIEYEAIAADYWKKLGDKEQALRAKFLINLDQNPQQNIKDLYEKIIKEFEDEQNPYEDQNANRAYNEAMLISNEAKLEFQRVYEVLGSKITPNELLEKIKDKYTPKSKINLYKGWENELRKAEWSGDTTSMLRVLEKLGYTVNQQDNSVLRPALGKHVPVKVKYTSPHDLMIKVALERKILIRNE